MPGSRITIPRSLPTKAVAEHEILVTANREFLDKSREPELLRCLPVGAPARQPNVTPDQAGARCQFDVHLLIVSAVLEGDRATPSAYLNSNPERFSYVHFATHGTASRTRPLESAVILSQEGESYKLYARDIVTRHLKAELVSAVVTRSWDSRTAASGRPTMMIFVSPQPALTSTSTG